MSERPYQPFYKPYGMTDEEYEYEKRIAAEKLAEWEQEQNESNLLDAQVILRCRYCNKPIKEFFRIDTDNDETICLPFCDEQCMDAYKEQDPDYFS